MRKRIFTPILMLTAVLYLITSSAFGGDSVNQRAKTAEKYFIAKQYDKAAPLFAQLISSNPKSYKFNYYYGICLLITGKDKSQALPYLEAAMQNPKTPEDIYYYLARAYHLTYNFDYALSAFTEFNKIIGVRNSGKWSTSQLMEMCLSAKKNLDTTKLKNITERTETVANSFYSHYTFANPNGKLLSMPDEIIKSSKSDKDNRPMIFLSANNRVIYYSAMSNETNSRDIFRVEKDMDGNWGLPVHLSSTINTTQDELVPTCNNDGRILYFSSRGFNSTGGFDIFKSYYNVVTKTFSAPENMGSPYNSPDDDFCFVASAGEQTAYFTSQRETGPGSLTVYKVPYANREELPIAINGKFNCIGQADLKQIHLVITRDSGNVIADLQTDKINGTYTTELPGAGNYTFKIEAPGFQTHSEEVHFGEFSDNIFIQNIFLSRNVNGKEDFAITSRRLNEAGEIEQSLVASAEDENGSNGGGITAADMLTPGNKSDNENGDRKDINESGQMAGLIFKVQIGAFHEHQRDYIQKKLEKKSKVAAITSHETQTWLRFFIGQEKNYQSAKNLKSTLIHAGFKDAFIVAFQDGSPMTLYEALKMAKLKK